MEKYRRLFAALERIFGKGYVSRLMGKQSNVITLPDKQARKFLDTELNIMEASEDAVKKGAQDLNNLISDTKRLSTLNDQELLTITNNAERLAVKVNPPAPPPAPTADIIPFTKKPKESGIKSLKKEERSIDDYVDDAGGVNKDDPRGLDDFFDKPEDFATGGRVGYATGGLLKLAMKFFNDNNPVSAYKKYLKYVKETAQKDPAKLAPEVGGIVVGSELIHRGLRRKLKEAKEKSNENDSENLATDSRTEKAGGGVSQGLDYLMGIERRGYAGGSVLKTIGKKLIKKTKKPNLKRQMTNEEITEFADEYGIDPSEEYYDWDGTLADAKRILKEQKDYESYMYAQYKMGKLDPVAGEQSPARMKILQRKLEEAEMTKDRRLINPKEIEELMELEKIFEPRSSSNINISDPKTAESFAEFAKKNDPEGYKKIEDIANKINQKIELQDFDITGRKKNAKGGLNYLMGL